MINQSRDDRTQAEKIRLSYPSTGQLEIDMIIRPSLHFNHIKNSLQPYSRITSPIAQPRFPPTPSFFSPAVFSAKPPLKMDSVYE